MSFSTPSLFCPHPRQGLKSLSTRRWFLAGPQSESGRRDAGTPRVLSNRLEAFSSPYAALGAEQAGF
jgi:hypothetical protein